MLANMKRHGHADLVNQTLIVEYTLARQTEDMLQDLLAKLGPLQAGQAQIIGFGVYIWNVIQTTELVTNIPFSIKHKNRSTTGTNHQIVASEFCF
ncbi:MAG: hypothetical protein EBU81_02055 [Proteobacteria bacterium]|nr:hypothetical protein [Pseudomonadota bacterium]